MQIPDTPEKVEQLDLMKLLKQYADGKATWHDDGRRLSDGQKRACEKLHTNLGIFVSEIADPILSRTTARELETFTLHDPHHARKVAHLMWHVLKPGRRERLSPPEIGLMVASSYMHDIGMALRPEEREERLKPGSELWDRLEIDESRKTTYERLRAQAENRDISLEARDVARRRLNQAEEALLCLDTRDRHADRRRYLEVLEFFRQAHEKDKVQIPDIDSLLTFDGDSLLEMVFKICESHGSDAESLVQRDLAKSGPKFPPESPYGACTADTHMVAAALRVADILDFDRERTPPVLFHYLLPESLDHENKSVLEWSKHLAVSHWHVEENAIVFRGRCRSHIVHHAVVQFCDVIEQELAATKATFSAMGGPDWPFGLPSSVKTQIEGVGYTYVPYKFELDDDRVYELLMGGAIYDKPLVAVRELIQNAVDACKLRDALTVANDPAVTPSRENRITVRYEEPRNEREKPRLIVQDTGTGMDAVVLQQWFLKVGRSYYKSKEFNEIRFRLRHKNVDFSPVSEFGIGFLSCFLMADEVVVETAMWEPMRRADTTKRTLFVDAPTRLIRMQEETNEGANRFKGTRVTLHMVAKGGQQTGMDWTWNRVQTYLRESCQELPYDLVLEYVDSDGELNSEVHKPNSTADYVPLPFRGLEHRRDFSYREAGVEGSMWFIDCDKLLERVRKRAGCDKRLRLVNSAPSSFYVGSPILRGGFYVSSVGSFVGYYIREARLTPSMILPSPVVVRLSGEGPSNRLPKTNLARTAMPDHAGIASAVERAWLQQLVCEHSSLPDGAIRRIEASAFTLEQAAEFGAEALYTLARRQWLLNHDKLDRGRFERWEEGALEKLLDPVDSPATKGLLCDKILGVMLSAFTSVYVTSTRVYRKNNGKGWLREMLATKDVTTLVQPRLPFAEFPRGLREVLMLVIPARRDPLFRYQDPRSFLNQAYKDLLLSLFEPTDIVRLVDALRGLVATGDKHWVSAATVPCLRVVKDELGDLLVGPDAKNLRPLKTFRLEANVVEEVNFEDASL